MAEFCHTEYASQKRTTVENGLVNLMLLKPYRDITVTDICNEVKIPRRTFYHYFGSKEGVLESIIEGMIQPCLLEGLLYFPHGKKDIEDSLLRMFCYWNEENRKKLNALIQNGLESRLISWSIQWIQKEQIEKFQNNDMDPKQVEIGLMVGTTDYFSLLFYWSRGGYRESAEQMAKYAVWILPHAFYNIKIDG